MGTELLFKRSPGSWVERGKLMGTWVERSPWVMGTMLPEAITGIGGGELVLYI